MSLPTIAQNSWWAGHLRHGEIWMRYADQMVMVRMHGPTHHDHGMDQPCLATLRIWSCSAPPLISPLGMVAAASLACHIETETGFEDAITGAFRHSHAQAADGPKGATNMNWMKALVHLSTPIQMDQFLKLWPVLRGIILQPQTYTITWRWTAPGVYSTASAYI